ncbi:TetR/AcrR family transcriptional regulator [Microbacterium sp. G2-8]|uniref:TetR/AcrR family transcriptional regulator n=1 Tax=Microbacterium sp. G2-8 TaxID=2842454 RepID=UPI001C8A182E|nr:TetR family transcriptional regulator [Microbacterium sp. G2-8]
MSRPSARHELVQTALELASQIGLRALTFDGLAAESGKTKGGILYHFPSKEHLVRAVLAHLLDEWDADALRHLDGPFDTATREDRIVAFLLSAIESTTESVGELSVLIDVMRDDAYAAMWIELRDRWVGDVATLTRTQQIALAAADGIWIDDAMQQPPFSPADRDEVVAELMRMVRGGA